MPNKFLLNLKELLRISGDAPVLISGNDGTLFVGSHTDYHSVILSSPLDDVEDFSLVIDGKSANQVSRSLSPERFFIELVEDTGITFRSKGVKLTLPVVESELTIGVLAAKFSKTESHKVDGKELALAVKRIKHAANDSSIGDVVLRGYHMTSSRDSIELMSSNGAVLAVTKIPAVTTKEDVILLNPEFHQLSPLFTEEVSIRQEKDTLSLESKVSDGRVIRVVSNLTYGNPIPYEQVVETTGSNPITLEVNAKSFNEALRAGGFFTDDDHNNRVSLKVTSDDIEIRASNFKGNSVTTVEPDTISGIDDEELTLVTGYKNLAGFLSSAASPTIELRIKDTTSPLYITDGVVQGVAVLFFK